MLGLEENIENVVYVALGSNLGDRLSTIQRSLQMIAALPNIKEFKASSIYETTPISDIAQSDYLNAVCQFKTTSNMWELLSSLQTIEQMLGKLPKPKNAAREIDLDILFFGTKFHHEKDLQIPHPRWRQRLFVIIPLMDLTSTVAVPNEQGGEMIDLLKLKNSVIAENFQGVWQL